MAEKAKSEFAKRLDAEVEKLRKVAEHSTDHCIVAKLIAISDENVRELLLSKLDQGDRFAGVSCVQGPGIPEQRGVLFRLDCPPGTICLVAPSFLAVINLLTKKVDHIIDPYHPAEGGVTHIPAPLTGALPFTLAVPSGAQNVVTPSDELAKQRARETAFLENKGVQPSPAAFTNTFSQSQSTVPSQFATTDNSTVGTQTWSGNPVISDDTNADVQADVHTDLHADTVADQAGDD